MRKKFKKAQSVTVLYIQKFFYYAIKKELFEEDSKYGFITTKHSCQRFFCFSLNRAFKRFSGNTKFDEAEKTNCMYVRSVPVHVCAVKNKDHL
jgi:hypothetical protein